MRSIAFFVPIPWVVFLVVVFVCIVLVRSESALEYTPLRYAIYKYEKHDVFRHGFSAHRAVQQR